jgi:hypothetical protein
MQLTSTSQFGTHDLFLEIARGNVLGASVVHKFGRIDGVNTTAAEDIWDWGGSYNFPTEACVVDIQSSSSSDGGSNGGARSVEIFGLATDFTEQEETVSIDGQDTVSSIGSYIRLHRMVVRTAGSLGECAGDIVATHTGTGSAVAQISQGFNQTLMAIYTVPASRTGYLINWKAGIARAGFNQNRSGDIKFMARPTGEVFQTKDTVGLFNNEQQRVYQVPLKINAKSDIRMNASAAVNGTAFDGSFDLLLLDNAVNF